MAASVQNMFSDSPVRSPGELRLNFALEGFRILRERPKLIAFWGAVCLFGYGVCVLVLVAMAGPVHPTLLTLDKNPQDVAVVTRVGSQILAALAACAPVYLLTSTILTCAVCRAVLDAGDDRLGFLRFGLQELRVLCVQSVTLFLSLALFLAVAILWSAIGFPAAVAPAGVLVGVLAVGWLRLRLSLNTVQSFATRRVDIFGSVQLTRGRSIALLGGYLLAFGLSVMVSYLCDAIIDGATLLAFGQQQSKVPLNLSSLEAFLTPARVTILALWFGLVWPQTTAIVQAAPVAAYRELTAKV